ncbi:kinesin-like protein [Mycena floridula]|nr:kinesin-like protein [Mycena floridula]
MAEKPKPATRSSSRVPRTAAPAARNTRAQASTTKPATPEPVPAKQTATRKKKEIQKPASVTSSASSSIEPQREPIMAFLRIRPKLGDEEPIASPYLNMLSDSSVRMTDPQDPQLKAARYRPSALPSSSVYKFSHVFPPDTTQSDFFTKTTLPLVKDALQGQNSLLFAYGVTNSGKTYTIQGGSDDGSAGILPRTLDVLFNSIQGLHGDGKYRPVRLQGLELGDASDDKSPSLVPEPAIAEVFGNQLDAAIDHDLDPTILKVDRNYDYTIWISYAEVYNEKVYDLLDSLQDSRPAIPRSGSDKTLHLTRQALPLRPSPASDGVDSDVRGKYIAGLRQFRVKSASEAKALLKMGQLHRRVFGTLANRESSRSHGMVILKIARCHRGEKNDPNAFQVSRLTLVDLAGSERTKHTHTTGDRLREAGNINKSLMVLGQCMEVMRANQRKLAMSLAQDGKERVDTRDVKKSLAVVPFRHSKLTEALMDYFVGDGRAVMIVNVNPYDTGYDENSHVMRFAALAREVYVTPAPAPVQRIPVGPGKAVGKTIKSLGPLTLSHPDIAPKQITRKVTITLGGPGAGKQTGDAVLQVVEVDENEGPVEDDDDDEPINPLVDALFDEVEELRMQLFESEMRCALIEAETREEVMQEMEERIRRMQERHSRRIRQEIEQNEMKTDAKIDLLYKSGLFASPVKKSSKALPVTDDEEDDARTGSESSRGEDFDFDDDDANNSENDSAPPKNERGMTFTRQNGAVKEVVEVLEWVSDPPMVPSDTEEAEFSGGEDIETQLSSSGTSDSDESEASDESTDDELNDWLPEETPRKPRATSNISALGRNVGNLSLS